MLSVQFDLNMEPPEKKHRNALNETQRRLTQEKEEAHRAFKLLKSNRPWRFSDRERSLLKKYYGIALKL